ncbi:MAG: bifunctional diaminohydroxyphosphoribosylaminopyrimidine deaminase/5-amino-6-(5-phosphoribosylamino)uracil reductase RibD [Lentisphaerae bacterium]|nr:bifunctional diaminohydroxyphosphoribosylaminopyrimidine deaminase/5-amino-6-(5-phosphoribosylamino)uracil reductase RibD [Lentisphaerota bacterium]
MHTASDISFMRLALECAAKAWGMTSPNPMVGAVIVRDEKVLATGFHHRAGTAHAEVDALNNAAAAGVDVRGAVIYVTLEPCSTVGRTPACTDAIIRSGLGKAVIGCLDPNPKHAGRGVQILRDAGIEVVCGVAEEECIELNASFFTWITTGKPFVMLKMASTLDGKTATCTGDSFWITGSEARARVQQLRRLSGAIMVGANTVRTDHPRLNVREPEDWQNQPLRLIASNSMTQEELDGYFPDGNARVVKLKTQDDWNLLLEELGRKNITALLIEGGGELASNALRNNVVDYVEFHIAPRLLGGAGSHTSVDGDDPQKMCEALELEYVKTAVYGRDIAVSGYLKRSW